MKALLAFIIIAAHLASDMALGPGGARVGSTDSIRDVPTAAVLGAVATELTASIKDNSEAAGPERPTAPASPHPWNVSLPMSSRGSVEFAEGETVFGPPSDCNSNGVFDGDECGDWNGDGQADLNDYGQLYACLTGAAPAEACACLLDHDADGDIDLKDSWRFQQCFEISPIIGADPPLRSLSIASSPAGSSLGLTEGNLIERYQGPVIENAAGAAIDFYLTYNSRDADGSRAQVDTVLGFGWTHSYNLFLFRQRGHVFRFDGEGRVTKYTLGPGGTYTAAPGYFETLVQNPDGTFTLTQKDGTVYTFASIPNSPFLVGGPVYRLTSIADRYGNINSLDYDPDGNLTQISDPYGGCALSFGYDSQNRLTRMSDAFLAETAFEYDPAGGRLTRIISPEVSDALPDPEEESVHYGYNALNQLTHKVDRDGNEFFYLYQDGKPVAIRDEEGRTLFSLSNPINWATDANALNADLTLVYLPSTTTETDGTGDAWNYDYESHGYITRMIAPDDATTTYTYDTNTLKMASMTDADGNTTAYEYDALGNRTKTTDDLSNVTTYTYEPMFSEMTGMTDPNGRTTTFGYDARGNRTRETDPLGHIREWTYDSRDNVLTERDKNGNVTTHMYDAAGDRTRTIDALGSVTLMQYDCDGNMTRRTDANGHATTYVYDHLNRLTQEIDPLGGVTSNGYDDEGNRTQVIDRSGNSMFLMYDCRQRLVRTIDALGNVTSNGYDDDDNLTTATDKNGHPTALEYDSQDRLTRTSDALGNMTSRTYDGVGNVLNENDANGHTTTYAYDDLNRRTTIANAVGCSTQFEYAMAGGPPCCNPTIGSSLVTKQIDGNGNVTYFKYDELDRLIKEVRKQGDTADVIDGDDAVTTYTYDPNGNRLSITEANGNVTTYEYDALNRVTRTVNAAGDVTLTTYDGVGNVSTTTAPNGNVTTYAYDARDRVTQVSDSVGLAGLTTYDAVGNRLTQADGNLNSTAYAYDAIYRLTKVTDPMGQMSHSEYDPLGNLTRAIDREGRITAYAYDFINRRTTTTDALLNTTRYEYDPVGNQTRIIDANNHATVYAFDDINRLTHETYADPTPNSRTFSYDCANIITTRTDQKGQTTTYLYDDLYRLTHRAYSASPADNFTYDLAGRMLTAERDGWMATYAYDGANRVTETTQDGRVIAYTYDIPARTRTVTYPGGSVVTELMDARDRLSRIDDGASPPPIVQYTYDLGNRVGTRTYRNGIQAAYGYNANDWVLSLEHMLGGTRIAGFGHDYDREGNKKFEEHRHNPARSEAYAYDAIYRLTSYQVGQLVGDTVPAPTTQTTYNLDPVGNWNSRITDGTTQTRTHNQANELTTIDSATILHDDNGNLTEDAPYRYAYDEENRLTLVTRDPYNQMVAFYLYDALGRRVVKLANPAGTPAHTRYFYDDARIIEEQDTSSTTLAAYVYGNYIDEVLTMNRSGQVYYYHQNALWSPAAITNTASNVIERYAYDAYGLPTIIDGSGNPIPPNSWGTPHSAIDNPYLFTARQLDEETALFFYRARYYDSVKGRFLQRDPLKYVDGMNLYEYVESRPTGTTDPDGMCGRRRRRGCAPPPSFEPPPGFVPPEVSSSRYERRYYAPLQTISDITKNVVEIFQSGERIFDKCVALIKKDDQSVIITRVKYESKWLVCYREICACNFQKTAYGTKITMKKAAPPDISDYTAPSERVPSPSEADLVWHDYFPLDRGLGFASIRVPCRENADCNKPCADEAANRETAANKNVAPVDRVQELIKQLLEKAGKQ